MVKQVNWVKILIIKDDSKRFLMYLLGGGWDKISNVTMDLAPWRRDVPIQSQPVSPPPITINQNQNQIHCHIYVSHLNNLEKLMRVSIIIIVFCMHHFVQCALQEIILWQQSRLRELLGLFQKVRRICLINLITNYDHVFLYFVCSFVNWL